MRQANGMRESGDRQVNAMLTYVFVGVLVAFLPGLAMAADPSAAMAIDRDGSFRDASGGPANGTYQVRGQAVVSSAMKLWAGPKLPPLPIKLKHVPDAVELTVAVVNGQPHGPATIHLNLGRLPKKVLASELRGVLGALGAKITVAEATYVDGKLEGEAVMRQPTAKGMVRRVDAQFKDDLLHGPMRTFYRDGTTVEVMEMYVRGVQSGERIEYYRNGSKRLREELNDGERVGLAQQWYPDGTLKSEDRYEDAELVSQRKWHANGQLAYSSSASEVIEHKPDGVIRSYYDSGELAAEKTFDDGAEVPPFKRYYRSGQVWEMVSGQVGATITRRKWWKNGELAYQATFVDGKQQGPFMRWYDDGTPWELSSYHNGKLSGQLFKWWKNGKLAHDYSYVDGQIDGPYKVWFDNGKPWKLGTYSKGKLTGKLQRWFTNGKLGFEQTYVNGKPHGPARKWYDNGQERLVATYNNGKLDGDFSNWLKDGSLYEKAVYDNGKKTVSSRSPKVSAPR